LYPADPRWYQIELDEVDEKDKKALLAKYEELLPKYPATYVLHYNYAVELFNYSLSDPKPADLKDIQAKFEAAANKAMVLDKTHVEPSFLLGGYYYNMIYDVQDELSAVKGNTPADQKKKADIKARMVAVADKLIPYAQNAFDMYNSKATLKPSEKGNFKKVAGYLATAYETKGDKVKAEEFTKKQDSIQ
jgi:hypothetical protein